MDTTLSSRGRSATTVLAFIFILVIAAALRFTAASTTLVENPIRADARGYVAYVYNWSRYGIFSRQTTWIPGEAPTQIVPDNLQQPGYPAFLRLFFKGVLDESFVRSVMFGQACVGIATVVLSFVLARMLLGFVAGLLVMLLVAMSPHLIVMENYLLSETLYTFLLVAFFITGVAAIKSVDHRKQLPLSVAAGLMVGLACLVRPPLMQLAPVVFGLSIVVPKLRAYRVRALSGMLGFLLVLAPWAVRNKVEVGQIGNPALMVNTLIHGSYPDMLYNGDPSTLGRAYRFDPRIGEVSQNIDTALAEIRRKFAEAPLTYTEWYLAGKIVYFFKWQVVGGPGDVFTYPMLRSPYFEEPAFLVTHALMAGLHWPLVVAGWIGLVAIWTRRAENVISGWRLSAMRWLSLVMAVVLFGNMIGAPYSRYSIPFRPALFILAVFAALVIFDRLRVLRENARRESLVTRSIA